MRTSRFINLVIALWLISAAAVSQGLSATGNARGAGLLSGNLPENSRFGLEMGTSFTSFSSGGGMTGSYISPLFEYDLNPSFTIITGGTIAFNRYSDMPQPLVMNNNMPHAHQQGPTDYSMFMSGRYMVNDNLAVTGTVFREEGQLPLLMMMNPSLGGYGSQGMMNPAMGEYRSHGMVMGLEYKITENLRFGAEVGMNRTNNPYHLWAPYSDPFGNRRYNRTRNMFSPF